MLHTGVPHVHVARAHHHRVEPFASPLYVVMVTCDEHAPLHVHDLGRHLEAAPGDLAEAPPMLGPQRLVEGQAARTDARHGVDRGLAPLGVRGGGGNADAVAGSPTKCGWVVLQVEDGRPCRSCAAQQRPCPLQLAAVDVDLGTAAAAEEPVAKLRVAMRPLGNVYDGLAVHRRIPRADLQMATAVDKHVAGLELEVILAGVPRQFALHGEGLDMDRCVEHPVLSSRHDAMAPSAASLKPRGRTPELGGRLGGPGGVGPQRQRGGALQQHGRRRAASARRLVALSSGPGRVGHGARPEGSRSKRRCEADPEQP
mmetsp:Transcript_19171/g.57299  ORF Transcript_19171/g.57299 Transcript_19171/m.57299 type:complete len:313 (-) Transcript_19171:58-996(-)